MFKNIDDQTDKEYHYLNDHEHYCCQHQFSLPFSSIALRSCGNQVSVPLLVVNISAPVQALFKPPESPKFPVLLSPWVRRKGGVQKSER